MPCILTKHGLQTTEVEKKPKAIKGSQKLQREETDMLWDFTENSHWK